MKKLILRESSAQTADSETGEAVGIFDLQDTEAFDSAVFLLDVTALATEAADKLDVYVDVSIDGVKWINAIHFTQQDGDGSDSTEVAKLSSGEFNDPDATIAVTSDSAESVTRNVGVFPYVRYRGVVTDASTDNASFTYSLVALLQ